MTGYKKLGVCIALGVFLACLGSKPQAGAETKTITTPSAISADSEPLEAQYQDVLVAKAGSLDKTIGFEWLVGNVTYSWTKDGVVIPTDKEAPSEQNITVDKGISIYHCTVNNTNGEAIADIDITVVGYDTSKIALNKSVSIEDIIGSASVSAVSSVSVSKSLKKYISVNQKTNKITVKKYCEAAPLLIKLENDSVVSIPLTVTVPKPVLKISFAKGGTVLKVSYQKVAGASKVNFLLKSGKKFVKMNKKLGISSNPKKTSTYNNGSKISKHSYQIEVIYKTNKGNKKVKSNVVTK